MAVEDHAVDGHVLAGMDSELVADLHAFDRHDSLGAVSKQRGGLGSQFHQTFEGVGGASLGTGLEHFADGDQRQDHGRRLEIELVQIMRRRGRVAPRLRAGHQEQSRDAVGERRRRAERHQRVHIGHAVHQPLEAAGEKLLVDQHDDGRQDHLRQSRGDRIALEERRQRPAPHRMPHGKVHQRPQEAQRREKAAFERRSFAVFQRLLVFGQLRRGGGLRARALERGAVARLFHGFDDRRFGRRSFHAHGIGQQTDGNGADAGDLRHGLFHAGAAGRAAHARNVVLLHHENLFSCQKIAVTSSASAASPAARRSFPPALPGCRRAHRNGCGSPAARG